MPVHRVKVDVTDGEGNKLSISFQGKITREKLLQLLDFVELLGGVPPGGPLDLSTLSKFEKLKLIVESKFPVGWFTSQDAMIVYEDTYDEPMRLSTVSTYLSRLARKRVLQRGGTLAGRTYRLARPHTYQKPP
jgi:hypothetical protein